MSMGKVSSRIESFCNTVLNPRNVCFACLADYQTASVKTRTFNYIVQLEWQTIILSHTVSFFGIFTSQMLGGKCFLPLRRVFVRLLDINTLRVEGHRRLKCNLDILLFDCYTAWHCLTLFSSMF